MLFSNPVPGPRIVPFGEKRTPDDVLPNGRLAFRVSQRFSDVNSQFPQLGQHGAIDLGNYNCGDSVLAAGPGRARTGTDNAGARYVIIDHGLGWSSYYWHLKEWRIPTGSTSTVSEGQLIGIVGDTGLGAVCHLHFEIKHNGVKQDPWPLLKQNATEDDMKVQGRWLDHVSNKRSSISTLAANFRASPTLTGEVLATFGKGTGVVPTVKVEGADAGGSEPKIWYGAWNWVTGQGWTFGYYHSSVLERPFTLIAEADCTAQEKRIRTIKNKVRLFAADVADD